MPEVKIYTEGHLSSRFTPEVKIYEQGRVDDNQLVISDNAKLAIAFGGMALATVIAYKLLTR